MCIYSFSCIVLKFLDFFIEYFCYGLEGYKVFQGKTAKENITPCKM